LIQDQVGTRNNDSKEPVLRFDSYKFPFHTARLATFATQSAISGQTHRSKKGSYSIISSARARSEAIAHSGEWWSCNHRCSNLERLPRRSAAIPKHKSRKSDRPGFQKMQVVVQKKARSNRLELCYVSNRGPMGSGCCKSAPPEYM